jgi:hypothetical protein
MAFCCVGNVPRAASDMIYIGGGLQDPPAAIGYKHRDIGGDTKRGFRRPRAN